MSFSEVFGQMIDGAIVEDDVKNHLQNWLPTYLTQLAEDRGLDRGAIALPKNWYNTTDFDTDFSARNTPAVLIISSGISGAPIREGDGSFRCTFLIGIGVVVSAGGDNSQLNSNRLARRYGVAIATAMLQNSALNSEQVDGVTWEDLSYDDVPSDDQSGLASVRLVFSIEYRNVLNSNLGPGTPDPIPDPIDNPYPDWGTIPDAAHTFIDLTKEPINEGV